MGFLANFLIDSAGQLRDRFLLLVERWKLTRSLCKSARNFSKSRSRYGINGYGHSASNKTRLRLNSYILKRLLPSFFNFPVYDSLKCVILCCEHAYIKTLRIICCITLIFTFCICIFQTYFYSLLICIFFNPYYFSLSHYRTKNISTYGALHWHWSNLITSHFWSDLRAIFIFCYYNAYFSVRKTFSVGKTFSKWREISWESFYVLSLRDC